MEYTVNQLAKLSKVSTRTLRYYDEIHLLTPKRISSNDYRIYGAKEVDRLQQILFYRELSVPLEEIKEILDSPSFDRQAALEEHLNMLMAKKQQMELLITNVSQTLRAMKGEMVMNDQEKFQGFKETLVRKNEESYGKEIRIKYGDKEVDASNHKMMGMTKEQFELQEQLSRQIAEGLKLVIQTGNPSGEQAQKVCELHKQWLCMFWKDGMYTKEMHKNMGEMYVQDERFAAYYDEIEPGAAVFLRDALKVYCR